MTNPKMQPGIKVSHRRWQLIAHHMGDYPYGECPKCGEVGNPQFDEPSAEDNIRNEWFRCDECEIDFYYETTTSYRYGGIDRDE